jgi:hypothetical protein
MIGSNKQHDFMTTGGLIVGSAFAGAVLTGADAVEALFGGRFLEHRNLTIASIALLALLLSIFLFGYILAKALRKLARRAECGN